VQTSQLPLWNHSSSCPQAVTLMLPSRSRSAQRLSRPTQQQTLACACWATQRAALMAQGQTQSQHRPA
jgi:hypothetical protein